MNKIKVYGIVLNTGDGCVYHEWFLSDEIARQCEEKLAFEGEGLWAEPSLFEVETYEGSNIHQEAQKFNLKVTEYLVGKIDYNKFRYGY